MGLGSAGTGPIPGVSSAGGAGAGALAGSVLGPLGALGGAAIGALGSYFSGKSAQDYAMYSEKHRYRWMVNDLQKAGLNPMLAVGSSPGSPPQPNYPDIGEGALKGASAASQVRLSMQQAKQVEAATDVARATEQNTLQQAKAQEMANLQTEASVPYQAALKTVGSKGEIVGPSAAAQARWDAELTKTQNEGSNLAAETNLKNLNADLARGSLTLQQIETQYAPQLKQIEVRYREAMARATAAGVPSAEADAAFWQSAGELGKIAAFIKALVR